MPAESAEPQFVRIRPGPCAACAGGATLFDFLVRRHAASAPLPGGSADEIVEQLTARERPWLVEWVESCPHTQWHSDELPKLDEGSEHIVYLAPGGKEVLKLTKPGIYGDIYYLEGNRVCQRCASPGDYLIRLLSLQNNFDFAPVAVGVTPSAQIATRQPFVQGEPPTQEEVDGFLLGEGLEPVKQSCWLWKKADPAAEVEYWVGDARADNFVKTPNGIVPIDLRMWGVVIGEDAAGA